MVCGMNVERRARKERKGILVLFFFAASAFLSVSPVSPVSLVAQQPEAPTDPAAVERGGQLLREQCGFCHGTNARGGSGGPDLTRSTIVADDENGKQLGAFLHEGRLDRGMPKFDLPPSQLTDLSAFLHAAIYANANRRLYKILDIVVGDPKAGEAYFQGAGRCASCHSPTRDLKGLGGKYDPVVLQGRLLLPRGRVSPPGEPAPPLYTDPTAIKATVTAGGETATGAIVRLTDFEVTIYDSASQRQRSWLRNGDTPKVVITDPLQAHVEQLPKWTDAEMHNMTAYLMSLK